MASPDPKRGLSLPLANLTPVQRPDSAVATMADGRPFIPDTAPVTEFGSKRFHDKIEQQHTTAHDPNHHVHDANAASSGSRFILPLREAKSSTATHDVDTVKPDQKKRGFFGLRHKVSLLHHPKVSHEHVEPVPPLPSVRPTVESTLRKVPLEQQFRALPNELQQHILSYLPLPDILTLRLASRSWHAMVTLHEAPIVRHHLHHYIPAYARRLYPVNDPNTDLNLAYLCGLWHRLHVAAKLSYMMSEWITRDIFLRRSEQQRAAFASQHERMRRRLIPLVFTTFHFFETYRRLHLQYVERHGHGLKREAYTVNPIEAEIMAMYDDQTLLRVHEVFPLIISSFCRRLRPPTYVGRVERSLRGYIREAPANDVQAAILCIGGMRQVERLWEIKGYNSRLVSVDNWYNSLTKDAPSSHGDAPATKSRRGLMSFGRKKSVGGDHSTAAAAAAASTPRENHHGREYNRSSFSSLHRARSPTGSMSEGMGPDAGFDAATTSFLASSLSSTSAPMGNLTREQAQALLDDVPVLQQIWVTTAEAAILQRRIVWRPQDIKRNQQVMLDLIREEDLDEEDEWAYGRKLHDSVRPPATTMAEDDAD